MKASFDLVQKNKTLQALSTILDEYSGWYGDLLACLFYPTKTSCETLEKIHVIFDEWLSEIKKADIFEMSTLDNVTTMHEDMKSKSAKLLSYVNSTKNQPSFEEFEKLSNTFEVFVNTMRRLEKDSVLEDSGVDVLTGLRSKTVMHDDLARELERLARRGKPFCLALAKIDNYDDIVNQQSREKAREYTKAVSVLIKKSIRSFDDGYRLGNGEFILSLKQADITGGIAALERLKKMLESENMSVLISDEIRSLTMSCCIAEPLPEDSVDELVANLRKDLETSDKDSGTVLEYHEMSDLERYMHESAMTTN